MSVERDEPLKNWDEVADRLREGFHKLSGQIRARMPEIRGGPEGQPIKPQFHPFVYAAEYAWDIQREFSDLVLIMHCIADESLAFARRQSEQGLRGPIPAEATGYLFFEIEKGNGESLRTLGPHWLMHRPDDEQYWVEVTNFTDDVLAEIERSTPMIIDELARSR